MDQKDRVLMEAMANPFHDELRALVKKHNVHGGYFVWIQTPPEHHYEEDAHHGLGSVSVLRSGCAACAVVGLAVAVTNIEDEELKDMFSSALTEVSSVKAMNRSLHEDTSAAN